MMRKWEKAGVRAIYVAIARFPQMASRDSLSEAMQIVEDAQEAIMDITQALDEGDRETVKQATERLNYLTFGDT